MKVKWLYGIIAGLFLAVFSLYPQFKLIQMRGAEWNGHYAYNDVDEVAYASYLAALIDGRPRRNDPYTGRDDEPGNPQPESLFSIQFAGPYTIAIPARMLGVGAPWAITIAGALAAFLTALLIFWLLARISGSSLFGMAGSLLVLAGGALFAGEGAIGEILGSGFSYPYFPGFRRYIPAMAFPAFFAFVALVWRAIPSVSEDEETGSAVTLRDVSLTGSFLAIAAFGYTVFSYFYVWTAAAAWLACFGGLLLLTRARTAWGRLLLIGAGCGLTLLPYAYLLANRSHTMDDVQLLVRTRALDLSRVPELLGFAVLIVLAAAVVTNTIRLRDRSTLLAISLAATPAVLFNQQLITGQSLQPIHYQVFIGNYIAGLAIAVTMGLLLRSLGQRAHAAAGPAVALLAAVSATWGFVECHYTVRVLDDVNVIRDEALPVARRLAELGKGDPRVHHRTVLHLGIAEADDMPTVAPQSVLWARHQHVFAGVTWQENKERYYQQLLYQGVTGEQLASGMKKGEDFVSMIALFGWGRHTDRLNSEYKPLTYGEIDDEARRYADFTAAFDARRPDAVRLDYLITPVDLEPYLDNLDKWYERTEREQFGKYVLFKLRLKE
jgi:hypothetical protein